MESGTISEIEHPVFDSLEEFQDYHMKKSGFVPQIIEDWRYGKEGDWVWSDDPDCEVSNIDHRRIVQLLKQKEIPRKPFYKDYSKLGYCRTIVGTFSQSKKFKMDTDFSLREYPRGRYKFGINKNIPSQDSTIRNRTKNTRNENYFCIRVARGDDAVEAYRDIYKYTSPDRAREKAMILLKQERIMSKVIQTAVQIADKLGINHQYVLDNYRKLFESSKDDKVRLLANEKMGDIIGTHPEKQKLSTYGATAFIKGFTPEQIEDAEMPQLPEPEEEDES